MQDLLKVKAEKVQSLQLENAQLRAASEVQRQGIDDAKQQRIVRRQAKDVLRETAKRENQLLAFSNLADIGKTVVVKEGKMTMNGVALAVKWITPVKDGSKTITSVEDKLGGTVLLDDGCAFENPAQVNCTLKWLSATHV